MGLKDITIPEEKIMVPGGEIVVRGLSLEDIIILVREFGPLMGDIFDRFSADAAAEILDFGQLGQALLNTGSPLVSAIIAQGCGEPDARQVARRLPAPVQIEALEKIGLLTVAVEGGLKKVMETVIRVAQASTEALTSLQAPKA